MGQEWDGFEDILKLMWPIWRGPIKGKFTQNLNLEHVDLLLNAKVDQGARDIF